jgi:hypothetical protein
MVGGLNEAGVHCSARARAEGEVSAMLKKGSDWLAPAGLLVAVLTLAFTALMWAEGSKWLPIWVSALTSWMSALIRPGALMTALAVVVVVEAWAILRLQTRLQLRLTRLETRFESHDHDDFEWVAKKVLKSKTGGMSVDQGEKAETEEEEVVYVIRRSLADQAGDRNHEAGSEMLS